jgi:hypothetical protein
MMESNPMGISGNAVIINAVITRPKKAVIINAVINTVGGDAFLLEIIPYQI